MISLLNIELMVEDGLKPKDMRYLEKLISIDPQALNLTQRSQLEARANYLTKDALKHFDIKAPKGVKPQDAPQGEFDGKTVKELRELLKAQDKAVGGTRAVLIARLEEE